MGLTKAQTNLSLLFEAGGRLSFTTDEGRFAASHITALLGPPSGHSDTMADIAC